MRGTSTLKRIGASRKASVVLCRLRLATGRATTMTRRGRTASRRIGSRALPLPPPLLPSPFIAHRTADCGHHRERASCEVCETAKAKRHSDGPAAHDGAHRAARPLRRWAALDCSNSSSSNNNRATSATMGGTAVLTRGRRACTNARHRGAPRLRPHGGGPARREDHHHRRPPAPLATKTQSRIKLVTNCNSIHLLRPRRRLRSIHTSLTSTRSGAGSRCSGR